MSRPSYATEQWLRTQLRLRDDEILKLRAENEEKERAFLSCSRERALIATDRQRLKAALRRAEYFLVGQDYLDALAVIRVALAAPCTP